MLFADVGLIEKYWRELLLQFKRSRLYLIWYIYKIGGLYMNHKTLGIDFGTSTIKIVKGGDGIVLDEKNVIAIFKKTEILAIGDEAYEMYEKAPANINVSYPIKNGVIADLSNMHQLMVAFLNKISPGKNKHQNG